MVKSNDQPNPEEEDEVAPNPEEFPPLDENEFMNVVQAMRKENTNSLSGELCERLFSTVAFLGQAHMAAHAAKGELKKENSQLTLFLSSIVKQWGRRNKLDIAEKALKDVPQGTELKINVLPGCQDVRLKIIEPPDAPKKSGLVLPGDFKR